MMLALKLNQNLQIYQGEIGKKKRFESVLNFDEKNSDLKILGGATPVSFPPP